MNFEELQQTANDAYFDLQIVRTFPRQRYFAAVIPILQRLFAPTLKRILKRTLWFCVSFTVRRTLALRILRALVPKARNAPFAAPVCVVSNFTSHSGIGEGGRLAARSLVALGYDVRVINWVPIRRKQRDAVVRWQGPALEMGVGTVIFHLNPEALMFGLLLLGRAPLVRKRIVGYWAWELPTMPREWIPLLNYVDEIWTPSRFVASAIAPFTKKPVRVVPHPVAAEPAGRARRADFGIPRDTFAVLTMFSLSSSFTRKNPLAAIDAFRAAFKDDPRRQLILKLSDAALHPASVNLLRAAVVNSPNIRVLEFDLNNQATRDLIASVDVVLSLHRSEGFGLVMAEAMHSGTAVVATNWSGNLEYMDKETACLVPAIQVPTFDPGGVFERAGQTWADPSVADAAVFLKRLAEEPETLRSLRERAKAHVADRLGLKIFGKHFDAAVKQCNVDKQGWYLPACANL